MQNYIKLLNLANFYFWIWQCFTSEFGGLWPAIP